MRSHRSPRKATPVVILVVLFSLLAAACGSDSGGDASSGDANTDTAQKVSVDVPGVSDTEIRYTVLATESNNPLGTCVMQCYSEGVKAYFDWRNTEDDGIYGRQLVVADVTDDEFAKNQEKTLEIISADDTFGVFVATSIPAGFPDLYGARIPTYVHTQSPEAMTGIETLWGNREVWCNGCPLRVGALVSKLTGATRVATVGYGVSSSSQECASGMEDAIDTARDDLGGAKVVYKNDDLAFGLPNGVGPEVTAMKEAGVDLVIGCIDLNGMKTISDEMTRQGMADVPMLHNNTYDADFVAAANGAFEGDYVQVQTRPFEADSGESSLYTYKRYMTKAGKPFTEMSMVGWINADLAYQGLKAAGPDFDREKVIAATNEMTEYTAGGLTLPVDWSRQHEARTIDDPVTHGPAQDCSVLVKVVNSKFEIVGDPSKPWYCWPGDTDAWSEPIQTNFD
jgi:branched-chain amino acid transport system substrate-binding protein